MVDLGRRVYVIVLEMGPNDTKNQFVMVHLYLFIKEGLLRAHFSRQRWPNDPLHKKLTGEKINKVRERGYIVPGRPNYSLVSLLF